MCTKFSFRPVFLNLTRPLAHRCHCCLRLAHQSQQRMDLCEQSPLPCPPTHSCQVWRTPWTPVKIAYLFCRQVSLHSHSTPLIGQFSYWVIAVVPYLLYCFVVDHPLDVCQRLYQVRPPSLYHPFDPNVSAEPGPARNVESSRLTRLVSRISTPPPS